jgi:telomerase reverse transcriptase
MKYMFPRQFRLHNVFTCTIDYRETTQPFKDYTLREAEIKTTLAASKTKSTVSKSATPIRHSVPKRLGGKPMQLVSEIRKRHQKCSYVELLRHYCRVLVC